MSYTIETPLGTLYACARGGAITQLSVDMPKFRQDCDDSSSDAAVISALRQQLAAYFAGERTVFDLPLAPCGTPFQLRVWEALRQIPFGQVSTYGAVAEAIGAKGAARAVGMACNRNPILLLIPCHRVVGAGGKMTGFGCGLDKKELLLRLEGHVLSQSNQKKAWDCIL